jgi:hypothetical protein
MVFGPGMLPRNLKSSIHLGRPDLILHHCCYFMIFLNRRRQVNFRSGMGNIEKRIQVTAIFSNITIIASYFIIIIKSIIRYL